MILAMILMMQDGDRLAIPKALPRAKISLVEGMKRVFKEGVVLVSARYELDENGKLNLAVYLSKGPFEEGHRPDLYCVRGGCEGDEWNPKVEPVKEAEAWERRLKLAGFCKATLQQVVETAEKAYRGTAYSIEPVGRGRRASLVMRLAADGKSVEARFDGNSGAEIKSGGGASPEEVFRTAQALMSDRKWEQAFGCFDPESAGLMLLGAYLAAARRAAHSDAELGRILKKHGIDEASMNPPDGKSETPQACGDRMLKKCREPAALFSELIEFEERHAAKSEMAFDAAGELKDVKVDGDRARGTLVHEDGKTEPLVFVKRSGLWFIGIEMDKK